MNPFDDTKAQAERLILSKEKVERLGAKVQMNLELRGRLVRQMTLSFDPACDEAWMHGDAIRRGKGKV